MEGAVRHPSPDGCQLETNSTSRPSHQKNEVILNGASAWALAVGRRAVKSRAKRDSRGRRRGNPVECLNSVRSFRDVLRELTGFFDSVPPRLRPRGAPLRMTREFGRFFLHKQSRPRDAPLRMPAILKDSSRRTKHHAPAALAPPSSAAHRASFTSRSRTAASEGAIVFFCASENASMGWKTCSSST